MRQVQRVMLQRHRIGSIRLQRSYRSPSHQAARRWSCRSRTSGKLHRPGILRMHIVTITASLQEWDVALGVQNIAAE